MFESAGGGGPGSPAAARWPEGQGSRGPGGWWSVRQKGPLVPCQPVCRGPPARIAPSWRYPILLVRAAVAYHVQDQGLRSSWGASPPHVLAHGQPAGGGGGF